MAYAGQIVITEQVVLSGQLACIFKLVVLDNLLHLLKTRLTISYSIDIGLM
jgi:hypothetical protein